MKNLLKKCLFVTSGIYYKSDLFFSKSRTYSGVKITIPFYHAVGDKDIPHLKHVIKYKDRTQFRRDIQFFASHFTIIGIPDLLNHVMSDHPLPPFPLLITFDDGLREFYEDAMPILEEFGAPAAIFINTDFLDNRKMFYRHKASLLAEKITATGARAALDRASDCLGLAAGIGRGAIIKKILDINYQQREILDRIAAGLDVDFEEYLKRERPYLSSENIQDMIDRGFFIGAHSVDHPDYEFLSVDQQVSQTETSMKFLAEKYHLPYRIFAAPFHDIDLSTKYFQQVLGKYVDISFGIDGTILDLDRRIFQRFNMETDRCYPAKRLLASYYLVMIMRRLINKRYIRREDGM